MTTIYQETRKPISSIEYLYECHIQNIRGHGMVVSPHVHDSFEMLLCVQGEFSLLLGNNQPYTLRVGDLALIDPMEVHTTEAMTLGDNRYYVLKFAPEILFSADQPLYELGTLVPYLKLGYSHQKVFTAAQLVEGGMNQAVPEIYREFTTRDYGYALAIRTLISGLFLWILRKWHRDTRHEPMDEALSEQLAKAMAYIEQNYAQEISMGDAAKACDMSYTAFSRFFTKYAHKGFAEALTQLRIKKAMQLLISSDLSVTEVAMQTGFSATSYFIQRFKEQNGVTPLKYRSYYRNEEAR